jgi:hypothetical protein
MHVRVVEAGQQPVTLGIDDARMRSLPTHHLSFGADRDKAAVQHSERLGLGLLGIYSPNKRVVNDELGRRTRIGRCRFCLSLSRRLRRRSTRGRGNRRFCNGDSAAKRRTSDEYGALELIKQTALPL